MSTNPDPVAFGAAIKARREELQKNQMEVWADGGPSNSTLTHIENGRLTELTVATAKKLDKGLRWPERTAWRLWRDGDQTLYGDPEPVEDDLGLEPVSQLLEQLADRIEAIETRMDVFEALREAASRTAHCDPVREAVEEAGETEPPQSSPQSQSGQGA